MIPDFEDCCKLLLSKYKLAVFELRVSLTKMKTPQLL